MSDNNGSNGNGIPEKPDANRDQRPTNGNGLGRFKSEEARARCLANLRPVTEGWAARELGLRGGRPRKDALVLREARKLLRKTFPSDKQRRTYLEKILEGQSKSAIKGNTGAAEFMLKVAGWWPDEDAQMGFCAERIMVVVNRNVSRFGVEPPELFPEQSDSEN